jgi:hypothetical protein
MAAECSTSFEAARIDGSTLPDATITRRTRCLWQRQKLQACRKDTFVTGPHELAKLIDFRQLDRYFAVITDRTIAV